MHDVFIFTALVLLPSITVNVFATYINIKVGYMPVIIYLLIFSLYQYVVPIVPNPSEYLKAIIDFILPILILFKVRKIVNKYSDEDKEIDRNYKKSSIILLIISDKLSFLTKKFKKPGTTTSTFSIKSLFSNSKLSNISLTVFLFISIFNKS